jgi:hypothetical protein
MMAVLDGAGLAAMPGEKIAGVAALGIVPVGDDAGERENGGAIIPHLSGR